MKEFDIFLSYDDGVKQQVLSFYKKLTELQFKVFMNDSTKSMDELAEAILNSKIFLCCVTKKYCESTNCKNEIDYAKNNNKKMVVLMIERLMSNEMLGVGFIIGPLVRFNCYKNPDFFQSLTGEIYESIISAINLHLSEKIEQSNIDKDLTDAPSIESIELNEKYLNDYGFKDEDKSIILNSLQISSVHPLTFINMLQITDLCLKSNLITHIETLTFRNAKNLTSLSLSNNKIKSIDKGTFDGLVNLKSLDLHNNEIKTIDEDAFEQLRCLEKLEIYQNKLKKLEKSTFRNLNELIFLDLSNNKLRALNNDLFKELTKLSYLNLSQNNINLIDKMLFINLIGLTELSLLNNPLDSYDLSEIYKRKVKILK